MITSGVIILTHDYSKAVLNKYYGEEIGEGKKTIIGNNVFLGMNTIVLMGTVIGSNVIVGAGSVVVGHIPDNCVIAGNPAKIICTLEDHYQKRKEHTVSEAIICAKTFSDRLKKVPTVYDMRYFKWLFTPRNEEDVKKYGFSIALDSPFWESKPYWDNYESFLISAGINGGREKIEEKV